MPMFAAAIVGALPELRAAAESLMLDTCTARRVTGVTTDPLTGVDTPTYAPVYTGRCKIGGDRPYEQSPEAGGATLTVQRFTWHVPVGAGPFVAGDVVEITACQLQPHLVGNAYRVAGPDERSTQTAQRIFVDLVS